MLDDDQLPTRLSSVFKGLTQGQVGAKLAAMRAGYNKLAQPNPLTAAQTIADKLKQL